jgi:hypothetical protein
MGTLVTAVPLPLLDLLVVDVRKGTSVFVTTPAQVLVHGCPDRVAVDDPARTDSFPATANGCGSTADRIDRGQNRLTSGRVRCRASRPRRRSPTTQ